MASTNGKSIFISHATQDRGIADALCDLIEDGFPGHFSTWYSSDEAPEGGIPPGGKWFDYIHSRLSTSHFVFAVVTYNSYKRPWVYWESGIGAAICKGGIIPILFGVDPEQLGDSPFHEYQCVNGLDAKAVAAALIRLASELNVSCAEQWLKQKCGEFEDRISSDIPDEPPLAVADADRFLRELDLHRFCGLNGPAEKCQLRESSLYCLSGGACSGSCLVFQDFRRTKVNVNPVYYLWADSFKGSSIRTNVYDSSDEPPYLRIGFDNSPRCFASNVAIRPYNEMAIRRNGHGILSFESRVPRTEGGIDEVGISIRLINGMAEHWKWITTADGRCDQFCVRGSQWQAFSLDLDHASWSLFTSDGNQLLQSTQADLSVLCSLVLVVGSYNDRGGEPEDGKGAVDVRNIRLDASGRERD